MFRFKQFTIQQDRTAMKVCTDACVLGAWAGIDTGAHLLDIGTGTGLLALMAAQRNGTAYIDAVELDEAAAGQARENVASSPFAERIAVHQTAIQAYSPPSYRYDHILTNPPFYVNALRSPDKAVNRALHADELPFADLLLAVRRLLSPTGTWWVLLPPPEMIQLMHLAAEGTPSLLPAHQLYLRHDRHKPVFRHLIGFRSGDIPVSLPDELCIFEPHTQPAPTGPPTYTDAFRTLLTPYYLIF